MAYFSISPAVEFTETDLTTGVTAVASSVGALAGEFEWGPVEDVTQVTNETDLVNYFGKPNDYTYNAWYTAWNFLQYTSDLRLVRTATASMKNAVVSGTSVLIKNIQDWETNYANGSNGVGLFAAKYPGVIGNQLKVSIADASTYKRNLTGTVSLLSTSNTLTGTNTSFTTQVQIGDILTFSLNGTTLTNSGVTVSLQVTGITDDLTLTVNKVAGVTAAGTIATATWEFASSFTAAPLDSDQAVAAGATGDGLHIVVVDVNGVVSGNRGQVIERLENLSKASNGKKYDGSVSYYKSALRESQYLWWMDHPSLSLVSATGLDFGTQTSTGAYKNLLRPLTYTLSGGNNGYGATDGELMTSFGIFSDAQKYDITLLMTGKTSPTVAAYVIQSVAEVRRDCVAFVSPVNVDDNSPIVGDTDLSIDRLIAFGQTLTSSSYAFVDSGVKYQYDKYNDVYRYIPLNGDCAGVTARSIYQTNEWNSPAGFNRGSVKNVTRLGVNPNKAQRDRLFPASINFVVSFPNSGPILFSDKTFLDRPSDFDAIGTRLLFILLEKSISSSARFFLFEQNNSLTQKLFVSMVTPMLRDIQGRGGITDFFVDVGPNVNTGEVIQQKTFAANIYIKPTKSIRFIKLNFIATPETVSFAEITGQGQ
ncbi:MAG TPA: phage tail sheath C-terminal domain-containing protein [Methanosarcina sp.]|nr:phage tail sheath C-terminal domain-containing protein [Methanosarcina sp.]